MNQTIQTILSRKSCKSFDVAKEVSKSEIGQIVDAGRFAPSAMNTQGWHFLVITNKEKLEELNETVFSALDEGARQRIKSRCEGTPSFFYSAPVFIVVSCSDKSPYPEADCACALQNMQLAAHSLSLGACWINQLTKSKNTALKSFLSELGMPEGNTVYGCLALGHVKNLPADKPRAQNTVTYIE